jgi:hypothetical protein
VPPRVPVSPPLLVPLQVPPLQVPLLRPPRVPLRPVPHRLSAA